MRRPHPATVIATLALVGAWGGPAVAKSLIGSREVRNESLTGRDIRNRSITGADIKANSVTGGDVAGLTGRDLRRDSIDGYTIWEEGLAKVPEASRADSAATADQSARALTADESARARTADAVGGLGVVKFHFARTAGPDAVQVLELGGLRLRATCAAPASLRVEASTLKDDAAVHVAYNRNPSSTQAAYRATDHFDTGSAPFAFLPDGADNVQGTATYVARDGAVVTVTFLAESGASGPVGAPGCLFAGTATGG